MSPVDRWLEQFQLDAFLRDHVAHVVMSVPQAVRDDLLTDPAFVLCDYEPGTGLLHVPVRLPTRSSPSRSVVLKRTLRRRPADFVRWVIAHEFAHAHLRNAGRSPGEDPEYAADALASDWGFPRPAKLGF